MEPNYLSWHYSEELANFINGRTAQIRSTFNYFNIGGLLKNLFSPYRRLIAKPKEKLLDRLSFDIISRLIGASVRSLLIATGLFTTLAVIILQPIFILIYFIFPFFTYLGYQNYKNNNFFAQDLESPQKFVQKLQNVASHLFCSD